MNSLFIRLIKVSLLFLLLPLTGEVGQMEERAGLPVSLLHQDGRSESVSLLEWSGTDLRVRTAEGNEKTVKREVLKALFPQSGGFGFVASLDEAAKGWDMSHTRLSLARWEEGEGWWFENAFTRRLRYERPEGGVTPMEVELDIAFTQSSPGVKLFICANTRSKNRRGPAVFFKMR